MHKLLANTNLRDRESVNAAKAISASQKSTNVGCLLVFGLIFFLAGSVFFYFFTLHPLIKAITAASWPEAQATITKSEVAVDSDSEGTTYQPNIEFEFVIDEQVLRSQTWSTGFAGSNSHSRAQAVVQRFPVGSQHPCYFDPNNPAEAVLDRSYQLSNLMGSFALIFVAVGGAMVWYFFRLRHQQQRIRPLSPTSLGAAASTRTEDARVSSSTPAPWHSLGGPKKLRPAHGRLAMFLGTLLMACFWNGISWVGFYHAWQDGQKLVIAFLSLFVFIGIALIGACLYKFLQLFNPVVVVAVSNGAPQPGETLDLAWESSGLLRIIKELRLSIIGEEVVTYIRGTSTTTERKVFRRLPLATVLIESEMRFGSISIDLPRDMIHSFEADNNKIVWSVEVHGDIPWWPDVHESMPFAIRPATVSDQQEEQQ
jgi:Protein of unknown function (DUF3592)